MTHIDNVENLTHEAVLDSAHLGDIEGALGTIKRDDTAQRRTWGARLAMLAAVIGPGLIVMVGDNDAGAYATYTQAGQTYGSSLLWTLILLIPVLYVCQEMVARLGAVTGVGHARLIFERFGKFWGAFSVIDLFLLNALTIVTEFIGISLAMDYFGLSKALGVLVAAGLTMAAVSTGSFRRFERFAVLLCLGSLVVVPIFLAAHPAVGDMARDLVIPRLPQGKLSDIMLLIIGIVGTTVAPWQLFFQQSYVVDKRLRPRHIAYERGDMAIGVVFTQIGAISMLAFAAAAFAGRPEFGNFTDAGGVAAGLAKYVGRWAGDLFAIGLIDAALLGAAAVGLSTSYALGDVLSLHHSLHRKPTDALGFYAIYSVLIALSAALVLIPGAPLGLITEAVQVLAGVLLPSATVFLLLLCNDRAVLGPWVNGRWQNLVTGVIVALLVVLSLVLTAAVVFPDLTGAQILGIMAGGAGLGVLAYGATRFLGKDEEENPALAALAQADRDTWRMPPLPELAPLRMSLAKKIWLLALRAYLIAACLAVVVQVVLMALHG
uniref:Divalent metal cation transporter n=1 Tax=Acidicaldus sp. TaxID=1872105 RepID=A0A8J4H8N6_9PROT